LPNYNKYYEQERKIQELESLIGSLLSKEEYDKYFGLINLHEPLYD
jgi:hypothetical protein